MQPNRLVAMIDIVASRFSFSRVMKISVAKQGWPHGKPAAGWR
jgi:hypothetical protein